MEKKPNVEKCRKSLACSSDNFLYFVQPISNEN